MARGRARYQRGRVVATEGGGWEIHYNIYLTDPTTGKPKRHHRSRVVGYKPKMHRADAEKILGAELAAINGGPVSRAADGTITFGNWMRNFYIPMRGANWREATRRTNLDYPEQPRLSDPRTCRAQRRQQVSGADAAQQTGYGRMLIHGGLSRARSDQSCIGRGGGPGCSRTKCRAQDRHSRDRGVGQAPPCSLECRPARESHWRHRFTQTIGCCLRLYPIAKKLGMAFHPTFQVLRRSFSTDGKKEAHPTEMQAQLGHSDIRTTLEIYTQIADPEVARMVNDVTNRILGLGEEVEPSSVQ